VLDHVARRLAGLDDLLAFHAARRIEDENHVLGHHFARLDARRNEQDEEAVLACRLIAQQVQADLLRRDGVVQLEVVQRRAVGLEAGRGVEVVGPAEADAVAGRVEGADGLVGRQFDANTLLLRRRVAVDAGRLRVDVAEGAVVGRQQRRVLDLDQPFVARWDGEDVGLDGVLADVLQQGGVAQLAHDGVVDAAGLVLAQQLGLDGHAVYPHRQLADGRAGGQRKVVGSFQQPVVGVAEELLDVGRGHLVGDGHADALIGDLQPVHVPDGRRAEVKADRLVNGRDDRYLGDARLRNLILRPR